MYFLCSPFGIPFSCNWRPLYALDCQTPSLSYHVHKHCLQPCSPITPFLAHCPSRLQHILLQRRFCSFWAHVSWTNAVWNGRALGLSRWKRRMKETKHTRLAEENLCLIKSHADGLVERWRRTAWDTTRCSRCKVVLNPNWRRMVALSWKRMVAYILACVTLLFAVMVRRWAFS